MPAVSFLLKRYLLPKEGNLLAFALWISVVGVALGIAVLMLVLSVMSGFQAFLQERYTRITSEIVLIPRDVHRKDKTFAQVLKETEGVKAYSPFGMAQGMVFHKGVGGAVIEGVDLDSSSLVTPWKEVWVGEPKWDLQRGDVPWIWLGVGLAKKLKVSVGDEISVMVGEGGNGTVKFRVTCLTHFGIYDHDQRYAYMALETLKKYFPTKSTENYYKVKLTSPALVELTAKTLKSELKMSATVKPWYELNKNIFLAVADQKRMLFIVLLVVVALSGVNVINLLMMSTHHRRRDIAILRAMGMRFWGVVTFFVMQGVAVAVLGIVVGVGLGFALCRLVEKYQPALLSEAIYNVTKLPIRIQLNDLGMICSTAFVLCVIFSVVPGLRAALMRPVQTLRVE